MADSDDLDLLLDSALDDFTKLDLASSHRGGGVGKGGGGGDKGDGEEAEAPSSSSLGSVRGLGMGMGLPDPMKGKGKRGGCGGAAVLLPKGASPASEALEKLTQQTREAVLGLGTATMGDGGGGNGSGGGGVGIGTDFDRDKMVEDFVKQFEELSGSQDMESIVETMMQQLLSKEILHEPMKEIAERYPAWLQEHKADLAPEDYDRYTRQFKLIEELNEVYEHEPNNFTKIVELMQKMQECGQPPNDIVHELAPDLDLTNLSGPLSPEALEASSNCTIM